MSEELHIDELARAAVAPVQSGMLVGLGTGRTARRCIRALSERVKNEGLDVNCVATSEGSEELAKELGLKAVDFSLIERIDYLFDGADEVDNKLRMLKGSGGAMTRERIIAWASERRVYAIGEEKLVDELGTRATLGVAVLPFGLAATRAALRSLNLNGVCRRDMEGQLFITDNGNLIIDVTGAEHLELEVLAAELNDIPGIADHGLFIDECDELLVGLEDGSVKHIKRDDNGAPCETELGEFAAKPAND